MQISDMETQLESLAKEASDQLAGATRTEDAIQIKNHYLGKKGLVNSIMKNIRDLSPQERPLAGQASNKCKSAIEGAFQTRMDALAQEKLQAMLSQQTIDVTLPQRPFGFTQGHPLAQIEREALQILDRMGFEVAEGPEVEEDFYNFEALNFPHDHPARDMQDTFMLKDGRLLRTHTSPVQVRTMLAYEPPIAVVSPGRTYRCDNDITHSPVFHQVEGLLIDKDVTFGDLKGTLEHFSTALFGSETKTRFRPSYFPFTEPSAEVDISCIFCGGEGCRVCSHTGWIEVLGCGMVDPNVLTNCGIDPEVYSGFAFGIGIERIAMLKLGINDIRLFFENDIRFLSQFE